MGPLGKSSSLPILPFAAEIDKGNGVSLAEPIGDAHVASSQHGQGPGSRPWSGKTALLVSSMLLSSQDSGL